MSGIRHPLQQAPARAFGTESFWESIRGPEGPQGPMGPQGPEGPSSSTVICEYVFSSNVSEPPTGSQVRLDNASQPAATKLWVRDFTQPGKDARAVLLDIHAGDEVLLQEKDDSDKYVRYEATGDSVGKTDYVEILVASLLPVGGPLTNNQRCLLGIKRFL